MIRALKSSWKIKIPAIRSGFSEEAAELSTGKNLKRIMTKTDQKLSVAELFDEQALV